MYSRLLYAKTRKESRLVSSGQYPCLFHQGASPAIQIPLLDGINQSTLVHQDQGKLASALEVCVWGGAGAGYVKMVMAGMCGPNFSYKLT